MRCIGLILLFNIIILFAQINIIPKPTSINLTQDEFLINKKTSFKFDHKNKEIANIVNYFNDKFKLASGINLKNNKISANKNNVISLSVNAGADQKIGEEGYALNVSAESIHIISNSYSGLFYGIQSLIQLLPKEIESKTLAKNIIWKIPGLAILDKPEFSYRGMHLDVARHFFPKEFVNRYIDYLAMNKMNKFHWHLTEDQGWRIEIKKYPLLKSISSKRAETILDKNFEPYVGDGKSYSGFYSQKEIKEIVKYASERFITIIPEIEMPGHSIAALAAYPELGCSGGPYKVRTTWGVDENVYCPGNEKTFEFLENVLTEVIQLFPGEYIHIGGDECPKTEWEKCSKCQARIKKEGLKNEFELQSYFVKRIEKFINSKGKRLIGWDEILEGGLAPAATVMSWRGTEGGITAANLKHQVIMTPTGNCYFDHYQGSPGLEPLSIGGYLPLKKVYAFKPIPDELVGEARDYILGGQGNMWSEYMKSTDHVEYMLFPRIFAMAEVLWSGQENKNFAEFTSRVITKFPRLQLMDINYAKSIFQLSVTQKADSVNKKVIATLSSEAYGSEFIYYTIDGSSPTSSSLVYTKPLELDSTMQVQALLISQNPIEPNYFHAEMQIKVENLKLKIEY